MEKPREYTRDEIREMFMTKVAQLICYWQNESRASDKDKVSGVVHSLLATLDGASELPGFIICPLPHKDDKTYHKKNGENWFPYNNENKVKADIGGGLHEELYNYLRKNPEYKESTAKYDYIAETHKVREAFKAGTMDKEQARAKLQEIEETAYKVYPNAEPDGDITYCVASAWGEINDKEN